MKRALFIFGLVSIAVKKAAAASGPDAVLLVSTNDPNLDEQCLNILAEDLRSRGVQVVDPSTVRLTYHQRAEVLAVMAGPFAALEASSVSWLDTEYHSSRALFVKIMFRQTENQYGEFTIYRVAATCSFRCINVLDGAIIKAGSFQSERHGEDIDAVKEQVANGAMLGMAQSAAMSLR